MTTERHTYCELGHRHWGTAGAAGLLMRHVDADGTEWFYLQARSEWVDHGGTYSVPGGALHEGEDPFDGAIREVAEELGDLPAMTHVRTHTDDHGGWGYHTVVVDVEDLNFDPESDDWEHGGGGWFTRAEMAELPLHPHFAASLHLVAVA
jgi:8-oxo-dGTP pyrophosphatase MutT (NUDIX family)